MAVTQESLEPKLNKNIPGQIDPDVVIPSSVRAAAARAEAAHKAAYPDPVVVKKPAEATPVDPKIAAEAAAADEQQKQLLQQPQQQPPPQDTKQPPQQAPNAQQDDASWEHKYTSMKGRYDKSQENIRQMAEQISNLQNVLATVTSMPTPSQVPSEAQDTDSLSPEEVSEYGAEFLDIVGKKARAATSPLVQSLQQEVQDLKRQLGYVGGNIAQNAREKMLADLDNKLPNWRQLNEDPQFISWLALPDAYSGAIRHNLLKAAWDRNDAHRSLAFFQGFLAEEAAVDPAGTRTPPNGSRPPQGSNGQGHKNGGITLESFAAPGRAKSAADIPAEKPFIKRSEISRFYADCAANRYRGQEAEQKRLEAMIFSAQTDGRIING